MVAGRLRCVGRLTACVLLACPMVAGASQTEKALRRNLAWQIALDEVRFSPGVIDGQIGPKTELATREFQRVRRLPVTGTLDERTASALGVDPANALSTYTVQGSDLREVGPVPRSWEAKSELKRLGYETVGHALAEKFHCTRGLLSRLNPGRDIDRLRAGDLITVPAIVEPANVSAARVEIHLSERVVRVIGSRDELLAIFHCSVAAHRAKLPAGRARVVVISENPTYVFNPEMWPEVKGVDRKLVIPPGPRNPVGLCWVGLSLPGYGIHGSPSPELIGRTGSHGCIRLTNWDALRLGRMVRVGTPVRFVGGAKR